MSVFQRRSLNNPSVPLSAASLVEWLGGDPTPGAIRVNEKTAQRASAVFRSTEIIAATNAGLPLEARSKTDRVRVVEHPFIDEPALGWTPFEYYDFVYRQLLGWGNFYALKNYGNGGITSTVPVEAARVRVGRNSKAVTQDNPTGKLFQVRGSPTTEWNGETDDVYTPMEMFHIPGIGYDGTCGVSPIRLMKTAVSLALSAEQYMETQFTKGNLIGGILQTEQRINNIQAEELADRWRTKVAGISRARDIVAMGSGAKFQPIQFNNVDMQMIENRRFSVTEIARWFGVPPHMLGETDKATSWGTGLEQQVLGFIAFTLRNWTKRVEGRVTLEILAKNQFARVNFKELLAGDSAARIAYYTGMVNMGAMNADEVREEEGKPPIPDGSGQKYRQPEQPLTPTNDQPAPTNDQPAQKQEDN